MASHKPHDPSAAGENGNPILRVQGLTKRYKKRLAVDDLSFSVNPGDLYGFLGRNGAGKSTTIRMIVGLVWPTAGRIQVDGQEVAAGRHPRNWPVGAIVESPAFYDYLTARTNLEMMASLSGGASPSRIDEIVELVGLVERQHEPVSVYSHGMRQRLGLAQALLPHPKLIIMDEPLDGLDPNGIRQMRELMLDIVRERGVTIFLSSHLLSEVELTCNRVVVIHEGRKMFEGPVSDLTSGEKTVRLRCAGGSGPAEALGGLEFVGAAKPEAGGAWSLTMDHDRVPDLTRALVEAGVGVLEITPVKRRLEDVFIDMTEGTSAHAPGPEPEAEPQGSRS